MGMIAPDRFHKHRMVIELEGPVDQKAYDKYKADIQRVAEKHHAKVLEGEHVGKEKLWKEYVKKAGAGEPTAPTPGKTRKKTR